MELVKRLRGIVLLASVDLITVPPGWRLMKSVTSYSCPSMRTSLVSVDEASPALPPFPILNQSRNVFELSIREFFNSIFFDSTRKIPLCT